MSIFKLKNITGGPAILVITLGIFAIGYGMVFKSLRIVSIV
ncbi:hypothetical protein CMALT430_110011 [Carnobacterium maltaromaticum]|nr:hypothetical protein CMALT430_110011 [Carnobacterium maltaromaticum]